MAGGTAVEMPPQVQSYLQAHHIVTIGTASFTGMPHAATIAYASDANGIYFSMPAGEHTVRNIDANHYASFTIDDYTSDFRKIRELRGVGRCGAMTDPALIAHVHGLFAEKLPAVAVESLQNLQQIVPLEVHFVDFEYTSAVAPPTETSIVYEAASDIGRPAPFAELPRKSFGAGSIIVRQGEPADGFFIVAEGEVELRREGHGADVVVRRLGAGQPFGEVGAFSGEPRDSTVTAVGDVVLIVVDRSSLREFASQSATADLVDRVREQQARS